MKNLTISNDLPEILIIGSFPPRVCGIATYTQDLTRALQNKFSASFSIKICALESDDTNFLYPPDVKYILKTSSAGEYGKTAAAIRSDYNIKMVLIQHEFGLFKGQEQAFLEMIVELSKPVVVVFHTVLPYPDEPFKLNVRLIADACISIVVMTKYSARILQDSYDIPRQKISVIPHGTHLVPHLNKDLLKKKYGLKGRRVLTTFGLLSSGKNIETTLEALPSIVAQCPDTMFLVIGKTHPGVIKTEGEQYRDKLKALVKILQISGHVLFIESYLALPELLEYLQLTDIYLFTSHDPNQAVSGTFAYAMSCACPIISTPIPHAREVLTGETGIIIDFHSSKQLSEAVIRLLHNEPLRKSLSINTLQKIVSTAWENSAVAHAVLFQHFGDDNTALQYDLPEINLDHLKHMTTQTGILQFSKINQPDPDSGYTLDDNARALITLCMHYKLTEDDSDLYYIERYLHFIKNCLQPDGTYLNYLDSDNRFTHQNSLVNLDDATGRAVWALGYLVSLMGLVPWEIISEAITLLGKSLVRIGEVHSSRAMAFVIKGLYFYRQAVNTPQNLTLIKVFAKRLVQMYRHESSESWKWFERYLTCANSILPEAMLYAWLLTSDKEYKDIALSSFDFLLSRTFNATGIKVVSNKKWLMKGQETDPLSTGGEQPIDVAYTIMTLSKFYSVFGETGHKEKMENAFSWFLGNNRLHNIVYNPCTGGCYDGLEEFHVNLNQGAESTLSYLMARSTLETLRMKENPVETRVNMSGMVLKS
jgi:glycosyltransferase involved in cell wall biosynthesis